MKPIKLVRITTVPISLDLLLRGQLKFMREQNIEVFTASADGPEITRFSEREGVPHKIFPLTRKITPFIDMKAVVELRNWLKEIKPDIVHTHTPKAGLIGMMAALWAGVPHRLHTVAGMPLMEATGTKRKILEAAERVTYSCATAVYPNSMNLKSFIESSIPVDKQKLKVIGKGSSNGIDTDFFQNTPALSAQGSNLRNSLGIGEKELVFTFVGRIVKDKGINELITAFLKLSEIRNDSHLVLVGPFEDHLDPVSADTRKAITEHPRIHSVGFQSDIRPYLSMTDVFVFPSYREGFPNVVLQAASFQLPVIVTDINGCNEIIADGENGIIVPAKDSQALLEAMNRYASNADLRGLFGLAARASVVDNYSQSAIWQALLKEYRELVQ
ncbi:glycosyltransferase family 4 protein [Fulvivirga sedimenti]|uniref:Glycosyltransferase family 4 protein n=1 Tax=Fulvivirga sedimenti TaxID=2879465 RepID=A0A9X1KUE3_9BACT|nr:glycosyltransferase family 4 protein [Fulvivirga sedimenti]MCA6073413.1 glycosyltransferase family 4 protein [Fulvivirga sedimenti]